MNSLILNAYLLTKLIENNWFRLQMSVGAQLSMAIRGFFSPMDSHSHSEKEGTQKEATITLVGLGENG